MSKNKKWPTDPPNFQAKRADKPFIFLGLRFKILYKIRNKKIDVIGLLVQCPMLKFGYILLRGVTSLTVPGGQEFHFIY